MAEYIKGEHRFDKKVKASWQMKIHEGTGRGKGAVTSRTVEPLSLEQLAEMDEHSIHAGLENIPPGAGGSTGFMKFFNEKVAGSATQMRGTRVRGGMVSEEGEAVSLSAEMRRNERLASGRTGFANHVQQREGASGPAPDVDENEMLHNEDGAAGFGDSFHGTPEDDYPDDRDKAEPYGGLAVGGSMEEEAKFTRPDHKTNPSKSKRNWDKRRLFEEGDVMKEIDGDNGMAQHVEDEMLTHKEVPHQSRVGGSGTTLEGDSDPITTTVPLQNEVVDTRNKHEVFQDLMPEEPVDMYVPNRGEGEGVVDPLGDTKEPQFNEDGSWPTPGKSQGYPDRKPRVTPITGSKLRVVMNTGEVLVANVIDENKTHYLLNAIKTGWKEPRRIKVAKMDIENMKPYVLKPQARTVISALGGIYDKLSVNQSTSANEYERTARKEEPKVAKQVKAEGSSILKKYFGMGAGEDTEFEKEEGLAHVDNSKGDGELYGDDKAMKDQLDIHERKMATLRKQAAILVKESEGLEKAGKYKEADAKLDEAERIAETIKNTTVKVAQLKKQASVKREDTRPFFVPRGEDEGMFGR